MIDPDICLFILFHFFYRRIVCYDEWSNIVIHVALDNAVIEEEICKRLRVNFIICSDSAAVCVSLFCMQEKRKKKGGGGKKIKER